MTQWNVAVDSTASTGEAPWRSTGRSSNRFCFDKRHLVASTGQAGPGLSEHRGRGVQRYDVASGEPLEKLLCYPATPATGIEHGLVPFEVQARHDRPPPSRLRQRQPVVRRAVPIGISSI